MKIVSVVKGQLVDKIASENIQKLCISVLGRILWGLYTPCIRIGLIANICLPGRKGTRARAVYCRKYAVFMPIFARITARYRPKPFISGAIENKIKKGALRFCARSNLWLLSFKNPEYRPLQACFNVETPSSLILESLAPARLGVTER